MRPVRWRAPPLLGALLAASLVPGAAVVRPDPFEIEPSALGEVRTVRTIVDGRSVHP